MVFRNTLFYSSYYKISCSLYFFSGLLYLALKHLTDRYNLYFNYRSPAYKYVDSTVHSTAVTFTMISTFFVLMSILFYAVIRLGKSLKIDVFLRLFTDTVTCLGKSTSPLIIHSQIVSEYVQKAHLNKTGTFLVFSLLQ